MTAAWLVHAESPTSRQVTNDMTQGQDGGTRVLRWGKIYPFFELFTRHYHEKRIPNFQDLFHQSNWFDKNAIAEKKHDWLKMHNSFFVKLCGEQLKSFEM